MNYYPQIINDPVHGFVCLRTPLLSAVVHHVFFQRLRHIKQLGLTHFVYPGACHSRFQHALGAMHLMSKSIEALRQKSIEITAEEAEAAEVAMLLHDIGHGPFSHVLEGHILNISHEEISLLMMQLLNSELSGRLDLAIQIFQNDYHKKFLHQLISSQLDMDRMDYLCRDSFFAGVAEGTVGVARIINMLNVCNNELVLEEKGIHSAEQFLIARRQMYWQVYMHKTVVAAEQALINALRRITELLQIGAVLPVSNTLAYFMQSHIGEKELDAQTLQQFAQLTDATVENAVTECTQSNDDVLRLLCLSLTGRYLPVIEISDKPFAPQRVQKAVTVTTAHFSISETLVHYLVTSGTLSNKAYSLSGDGIKILTRKGTVCDIGEASDMLDATAFLHDSKKYFLCCHTHSKSLDTSITAIDKPDGKNR